MFHLLFSLNTFAIYWVFLQLELHQEALTISQSVTTVISGKNSMEAEKVTKLFSLTREFFKNLNY